MILASCDELKIAEAISSLNYANPFLEERQMLDKTILGEDYIDAGPVWSLSTTGKQDLNVERIKTKTSWIVEKMYGKISGNGKVQISKEEKDLYANLVIYHLFEQFRSSFIEYIAGKENEPVGFYGDFLTELERLTRLPGCNISLPYQPSHLFAMYFQIHRAFRYIFRYIVGGSMPTARLRASVWQSIFTHNMSRYSRTFYPRMNDITTLITGPSGTGKELVARAIAFCRYIPFDAGKLQFEQNYLDQFSPLHLSAMSHNLIESELFGHRKGAFTGALEDRASWLENSSQYGTVFLDEIGEINEEIQVKLLRLLQERIFHRVGETKPRVFKGKIIAATNRNLESAMNDGRFRKDLYYRICADMVTTPSLREQLDDSPGEIENLVEFLCTRILGEENSASLAKETLSWIKKELGPSYEWPGNVRELEQCVFNILVRGSYNPPARNDRNTNLSEAVSTGDMTADELINRYCLSIYRRTRSYAETSKILELDRRTVKSRIDKAVLSEKSG
ncbi:MAG TPA: sigma-54-dependent Fis family transcriptional regulator [Lentisphaeria bacterium]|nr:MAG: hypothetical protein A2X45_04170 [Lentisphaerae bacterium GWF2_50_93]HCE46243.1 sigma-54-dependent Fis family transcriptional regulator [Lentisphaeria bacterium]